MGRFPHPTLGIPLARRLPAPGKLVFGGAIALRTTPFIAPGIWTVDPAHSSVEFSVKHMGIANVRGVFNEFDGTLDVADDLAGSKARGTVKVASLDTNEEQRDEHLRS